MECSHIFHCRNSRNLISGSLLARNTLLNFLGQAVPLLVGVVTTPLIVNAMGTERFGLLSLAWAFLGYFTIFDLGLGRATSKYVAEALGKGEEDRILSLVWTAATIQVVLGILGALVLIGITPFLVEHLLYIPTELIGEAKTTFYLLALALPIILVSGSLSGVLEAKQRFDLLNAVRIPSGLSTYFLTLGGLLLGLKLPGIVTLILVVRFGALSALIAIDLHLFPKLRRFSATFALFPRLSGYGSWVTVTGIVGPLLLYFDRFLIASLLSMATVAYYTAPYEAIIRLLIIPTSFVTSIFPAFSALGGIKDRQRLGTLYARSIKYNLLVTGPAVLILVLFAEEILQYWLGGDFAKQSKMAMQILALGVLINSLAHFPYALLQAVGRPDLTAKFHLLELPFYVVIAWFLVSNSGITGAAAAWTLRVTLDVILLFIAALKVCMLSPTLFAANGLASSGFALMLLIGIAYGVKSLAGALLLPVQYALFVTLLGLFGWVVWKKVLDPFDRGIVLKVVKPWKEL